MLADLPTALPPATLAAFHALVAARAAPDLPLEPEVVDDAVPLACIGVHAAGLPLHLQAEVTAVGADTPLDIGQPLLPDGSVEALVVRPPIPSPARPAARRRRSTCLPSGRRTSSGRARSPSASCAGSTPCAWATCAAGSCPGPLSS